MSFQPYQNMIHSSGACDDKIAFCLRKSTELLPSVIEFNGKRQITFSHTIEQSCQGNYYARICGARAKFSSSLTRLTRLLRKLL